MSELLNEYGNITYTRSVAASITEFFRHITAATFYGFAGDLDDVAIAGTFTGHKPLSYTAKITTAAGTDKFDWSDDNGATWTTEVSMTGAAQTLSEGVTIDFNAATGHTVGSEWKWTAFCVPEANIAADVFTGSGLNDLTPSGVYNGGQDIGIRIKVTTEAGSDKFRWTKYGDLNIGWSEEITMTGAAQGIINGMLVAFNAATGHTLGDYWDIECTAAHCELLVNSITGDIITAGAGGTKLSFKDEQTGEVFFVADVDTVGDMSQMSREGNPVILRAGSDVTVTESAGTQVTDVTISAYLRLI